MNDQMILDRMAQMIRVGFVNARQPEKMRLKVTIPDTTGQELVTDWLPVLCPRACQDMQYDLPDIGDQVLCLFLPYGLEQGFVLGAMYGKQTPPVQSGDKWHRLFSDGTWLEYDRANHTLNGDVKGTVTLKADQSVTIETPIIYLRGTLVNTAMDGSPGKAAISGGVEILNGGLNVPDADVQASGVSLTSHKTEGVQSGNDTSSHPAGGSAESKGTNAINLSTLSVTEALLLQVTHLAILNEKVNKDGDEIDKLIICLPKIAENMAKLAKEKNNELEEKAWKYLREMFLLWLSTLDNRDANKCEKPVWVDWDWVMSFSFAQADYDYFVDSHPDALLMPNRMFSKKSYESLGNVLKKQNFLRDELSYFNFIESDWKDWEKYYYTFKPANGLPPVINLDGLNIALNKFTFRALADGYTELDKDGKHLIHVKKVAVFVHDIFNFDPSTFEIFDNLRYWSCADLMFSKTKLKGYIELNNKKIRDFREKYSYGGDFLVLSKPHIIDSFKGTSYVYP